MLFTTAFRVVIALTFRKNQFLGYLYLIATGRLLYLLCKRSKVATTNKKPLLPDRSFFTVKGKINRATTPATHSNY